MVIADDAIRYAQTQDGLFVGQPMNGQGTFGDWAFARVMLSTNGGQFQSIEFVRFATNEEVATILGHPILYWFVLAHPHENPTVNTWALMQFRFNPCAVTATAQRQIHRPDDDDLSSKVAV